MAKKTSGRIDDIEALRAIAVLFTMIDHVPYMLPWGSPVIAGTFRYMTFWSGVDLFFAISGFVIARSVLQEFEQTAGSAEFWRTSISFWIKRIFRIWPASWFWLLVVACCSIVMRDQSIFSPLHVNVNSMVASILQVQNIHLWSCVSSGHYNDCFGDVGAWWSLSLEEQFYIALPLALLLFKKRFGAVLGLLVAVQIFLPRPPLSFLWVIRTDALCLGVLLAMFSRTKIYEQLDPRFMSQARYAVPVIALLIFMLGATASDSGKMEVVPFATGLVAIVAILMVSIASFDRCYIARGTFPRAILMWVGSRSYSLYLAHFPALQMTKVFWKMVEPVGTIFGANYSLRYLSVWLLLSGLLSEMTYRLIEQPLRHRGREIAGDFMSTAAQPVPEEVQSRPYP